MRSYWPVVPHSFDESSGVVPFFICHHSNMDSENAAYPSGQKDLSSSLKLKCRRPIVELFYTSGRGTVSTYPGSRNLVIVTLCSAESTRCLHSTSFCSSLWVRPRRRDVAIQLWLCGESKLVHCTNTNCCLLSFCYLGDWTGPVRAHWGRQCTCHYNSTFHVIHWGALSSVFLEIIGWMVRAALGSMAGLIFLSGRIIPFFSP